MNFSLMAGSVISFLSINQLGTGIIRAIALILRVIIGYKLIKHELRR